MEQLNNESIKTASQLTLMHVSVIWNVTKKNEQTFHDLSFALVLIKSNSRGYYERRCMALLSVWEPVHIATGRGRDMRRLHREIKLDTTTDNDN